MVPAQQQTDRQTDKQRLPCRLVNLRTSTSGIERSVGGIDWSLMDPGSPLFSEPFIGDQADEADNSQNQSRRTNPLA